MIISRLGKSFRYAGRGLLKAWREETNFRIEVLATVLVLVLALVLRLGSLRFAILGLTCGFVLTLELINTMIENISDLLKPRLDQYVKEVKDISSAAVLVAALSSLVVACCLLLPPLCQLISWQA